MVSVLAQEISGVVFDSATNEPLVGAVAYFDGSSLGTTTNEEGEFTMKSQVQSTAPLIITYLGYTSVTVAHQRLGERLEIGMQIGVFEIPEVIVLSDPFDRKEKLKLFKKQFLGTTWPANHCIILNENVIELYFNSVENQRLAYAQEPIIVKNEF